MGIIIRPRKNFWSCLSQRFFQKLVQNMSGVAISSHLKKDLPGQNGSKVEPAGGLFQAISCPTSDPF